MGAHHRSPMLVKEIDRINTKPLERFLTRLLYVFWVASDTTKASIDHELEIYQSTARAQIPF